MRRIAEVGGRRCDGYHRRAGLEAAHAQRQVLERRVAHGQHTAGWTVGWPREAARAQRRRVRGRRQVIAAVVGLRGGGRSRRRRFPAAGGIVNVAVGSGRSTALWCDGARHRRGTVIAGASLVAVAAAAAAAGRSRATAGTRVARGGALLLLRAGGLLATQARLVGLETRFDGDWLLGRMRVLNDGR